MALLPLTAIRTDGGTQPRANISEEVVSDYCEAFQAGDTFPPVVVFHDGADHWLADGFHRVAGALKAERAEIEADVRQGTRRDAVLFCLGANADPRGLRRTNEDKRRAVMTMLRDEEWQQLSDRDIAKHCCITHPFVSKIREELSGNDYQIPATRKVTRGGTTYTMKVRGKEANGKSHDGADARAKADERIRRQQANGTPEPVQEPEILTDQEGHEIPEKALPAFQQSAELNAACRQLDDLIREVERLGKSPVGAHLHYQSVQTHLKNAKNGLWTARPTHVCPYCKGKKKTCDACRAHGWVTASTYKAAPEELRKS